MVLSESQQANLLRNSGSSLPFRVKRLLVTFAIVLCAVVTPCESQNVQLGCGKRKENAVSTRIIRGDDAKLGEWPWNAEIFASADNKPKYVCGGSIIHKRAVISSAHCFVAFNRLVHEDLITVHVGRLDLNASSDGLQVLNVSKIIPHPKFVLSIGIEYDIAILKLSTDIVMSWSVRPVCVWDMGDDDRQLVGQTGTVVGFGLNENDELSGKLQKAELTVVDLYACLDNDRETYGDVLPENMYCAGGKANGDSGGGMFFERNGTWYIRGIISFTAKRPNVTLCDSCKFTVLTDVRGYSGWIMESILGSSAIKRPWYQTPCKGKTVPKDGICNVAKIFDYNFLLVGGHNKMMRVPLRGGKKIKVSTMYDMQGLDHDCAEGRFYWGNNVTNQILSAKYDGTDQKVFIEENMKGSDDLAVDWISRRLYWVDKTMKTINVASLENPNVRTVLIDGNLYTYAIAVDPLRGKLYWTTFFNGENIEWSNLDGTERQVLLSSPHVLLVRSIKVSTATGELCYLDVGYIKIECIDPFSKQIRTMASNLTLPHRFTLTDKLIYWTNLKSETIESIDMNGVRQKPIPLVNITDAYPVGMTAISDKCPLRYSPCAINNGDCPENTICLVNPSAPAGKSCIVKKM
uniref:Peptidase S1 domain-containing protein n=1 Tax=Anopheles atroparvus TaxID=41427 RepID=A0AAG5DIG3_ANOAO